MPSAKEKILEEIIPTMKKNGYRFYKGKNTFLKKENDFEYHIKLTFDGRGGLSLLDHILFGIKISKYKKTITKLIGIDTESYVLTAGINGFSSDKIIIPVPYSQQALDIANTMNFKELAKLSFEEKYPKKRIENTAFKILEQIKQNAFPFFEEHTTIEKIYAKYILHIGKENNLMNFYTYRRRVYANKIKVLFFLLMSHDLNKPLPDIVLKYKHFHKDMINSFGYLNKTQDLKKNLKALGINFNPK